MANKIIYGLSNAVAFPITATAEATGVPTYGTAIALKGSTELTLDAEGSSDPFYADNGTYYTAVSNNGYSGSLTLADVPKDFMEKIMGEKSNSKAHFEDASVLPNEFALAFQFEGDDSARRHIFFRCIATRPSVASSTKADSISPNTVQLSIKAMPRLDNAIVKAYAEKTDGAYANWFEAPVVYNSEEE